MSVLASHVRATSVHIACTTYQPSPPPFLDSRFIIPTTMLIMLSTTANYLAPMLVAIRVLTNITSRLVSCTYSSRHALRSCARALPPYPSSLRLLRLCITPTFTLCVQSQVQNLPIVTSYRFCIYGRLGAGSPATAIISLNMLRNSTSQTPVATVSRVVSTVYSQLCLNIPTIIPGRYYFAVRVGSTVALYHFDDVSVSFGE